MRDGKEEDNTSGKFFNGEKNETKFQVVEVGPQHSAIFLYIIYMQMPGQIYKFIQPGWYHL
jgi:hypothetical protein